MHPQERAFGQLLHRKFLAREDELASDRALRGQKGELGHGKFPLFENAQEL